MTQLHIYASSRVGCVRTNNEDMILIGNDLIRHSGFATEERLSDNDRLMIALADGMGGHNSGEVASADVLANLRFFFNDLPGNLDDNSFVEAMNSWLKSISTTLEAKGKNSAICRNMGTTLVSMIYYAGRYYWLNCGDSRLYRYHDNELTQLTTDHSLNNLMGLNQHSSQIYNCIGGGCRDSFLDIKCFTESVEPGDVFVLCSDGLTDMVEDSIISKLLCSGVEAEGLCDAAENAGGYDNVSVVVVRVM